MSDLVKWWNFTIVGLPLEKNTIGPHEKYPMRVRKNFIVGDPGPYYLYHGLLILCDVIGEH